MAFERLLNRAGLGAQRLNLSSQTKLNPIHFRCRLLSKIIGDMEHEYHEEQKAGENFQKLARGVL
jgi:hypothetical protein